MIPSRVGGALALTACVLAATPARSQTAEELVQKNIAARGGEQKLKAIQSSRITRTFAGPFGNMKVVVLKKRPNLYRSEQTGRNGQLVIRAVNANTAWEHSAGKVTRRPPAIELEQREVEADFDGVLVDYRAKGHQVSFEGREKLPGTDAFKLKVTLKSGAVRYIYLDSTTYLERRAVYTMIGPRDSTLEVEVNYSDYRDVEGIKVAFALDEDRNAPGQTYAVYTEKVELNVPLGDELFVMPAASSGPDVN